jgi:hypothetical protein
MRNAKTNDPKQLKAESARMIGFQLALFRGHCRFVLLVLFVSHLEFIAHVMRVLVFPIPARVGVRQEWLVGRIGQSRVDDLGRAALPALDQMAGADAAIADRRDTFAALDLAGHRQITILACFGGQRGRNEAPVPSSAARSSSVAFWST